MKRPWQIWLLFLLCLALVAPGFAWITVRAVQLDDRAQEARRQTEEARRLEAEARQQTELARQQAEIARQQADLQERVSSALWRMDWTLTPIVAQEAARPYFVYRSFLPVNNEGKGGPTVEQTPSPLLVQPSPYVMLHFQIGPDNDWSSPQNPPQPIVQTAIANGAPQENIRLSEERLQQLKKEVKQEVLMEELPERFLPRISPEYLYAQANWLPGTNVLQLDPTVQTELEPVSPQDSFQQAEVAPTQQAGVGGGFGQPQYDTPVNNPGNSYAPQTRAENPPNQAPGPAPSETGQTAQSGPTAQPGEPAPGQQQAVHRADQSGYGVEDYQAFYRSQREAQMLRGGNEWARRNRAYQNFAQNQIVQQRVNTNLDLQPEIPLQSVGEGVSRPLWVGNQLLLARRVKIGDRVLIQGCWLNWQAIKAMLLEEVSDLLPDVDLAPIKPTDNVPPGRALATLPVQLIVSAPTLATGSLEFASINPEPPPELSPIRLSLIIAWVCFLFATIAVGGLLQGVITLSERRGAFVAAVTHELRTPLTTFRMYAEMLAAGMVKQEDKKQRYLETLRVEADRLSHLVENVLSYARLERGKGGRRESIALGELIEHCQSRLQDRAEQAEMQMVFEIDPDIREESILTDPGAVEQILFNLVDNACKYAATAKDKRIHVQLVGVGASAELSVSDHGPGIASHERSRLFQPFSKSVQKAAVTAPGVGLGLALCRRLATELGGRLFLAHTADGARFVLQLPRPR